MEFIGRVTKVLPVESGISSKSGNEWKKQGFVFEYFEHDTDLYPDRVKLELMGERVGLNLQEGEQVKCVIGLSVREWEGKYYNEPRLYRIERVGDSGVANGSNGVAVANGQQQTQQTNQQTTQQTTQQPQQQTQQTTQQTAQQEGGHADDLPF